MAINSNGHIFAGNDGLGLYRSTDYGQNWTMLPLTNSKVLSIEFSNGGDVLVGCRGSLWRSTDNGDSWSSVETLVFVYDFARKPNGELFALDFASGLYRSSDNGLYWIKTGFRSGYYWTVALNSPGHIFVGGLGIHRSTDNGETWGYNRDIYGNPLTISPNDYIFAGSSGSLVRSTDNGNSWLRADSGLNTSEPVCLAVNVHSHIFTGTYRSGVFRSTDNGDTWIQINSGLTRSHILSLGFDQNGYIYAGTDSGGVFRSVQSTTLVGENASEIPRQFTLEQNYPNPFNPITVIKYELPKIAHVTIKVYDMLGREVRTLVDELKEPGYYEISLDASPLASGVYFYKMVAGGFVAVRKLVVMK